MIDWSCIAGILWFMNNILPQNHNALCIVQAPKDVYNSYDRQIYTCKYI